MPDQENKIRLTAQDDTARALKSAADNIRKHPTPVRPSRPPPKVLMSTPKLYSTRPSAPASGDTAAGRGDV